MNDMGFNRLGLLSVAVRRRMYEFIRQQRGPVTRDEAAAAASISRKLAAFHLDKLVEAGLLTAAYARPAGKGGPGAGRPAKVYEPADVEVEVSVPERHYDIPGQILLEALETRQVGEEPKDAAERVALRRGIEIAQAFDSGGGSANAGTRGSVSVEEVLRSYGFEPYTEDATLRLHNCPFHHLAQHSPELICGMNRALIDGILDGLSVTDCDAALEPRPSECCVAIRRRSGAA